MVIEVRGKARRRSLEVIFVSVLVFVLVFTGLGYLLGGQTVYAKDVGNKNEKALESCNRVIQGRAPFMRDYSSNVAGTSTLNDQRSGLSYITSGADTGYSTESVTYESVIPGAVYRGGNAESGLQSGEEFDKDPNDFASILPYGNTFIDTKKINFSMGIVDIKDNRFKWIAGSNYASYEDKAKNNPVTDPLGTGKGLAADLNPIIAYVGHLDGYLGNTDAAYRGDSDTDGQKNIFGDGTDYLYRITYPNAVTLNDGTKGNLIIEANKVVIETTATQDNAIVTLQRANEMDMAANIKDKDGKYYNTQSFVAKTADEVRQSLKGSGFNTGQIDGLSKDKYCRTATGAIVDLTVKVTNGEGKPAKGSISYAAYDMDLDNYMSLWGRKMTDNDRFMFNEAMTIKDGALSYAVTPYYDHANETERAKGWVPVYPGSPETLQSPLNITKPGSGSQANGVRFSGVGAVNMRDKNGSFKDALFAWNSDPGAGNDIRTALYSNPGNADTIYENITNYNIDDNIKKQLQGDIMSGGTAVSWDQMTNQQIFDYVGAGSYGTRRGDDSTYDTGFAVLLNAKESKLQWSGSMQNGGSVVTTLFDTSIYTRIEQTHGTGGGIYFETYDIANQAKVNRAEGVVTMGKGTDATVTVVPEDGYRINTIQVGETNLGKPVTFSVLYDENNDKYIKYKDTTYPLTAGIPVTIDTDGPLETDKVYGKITFDVNDGGSIDVTIPNIQDPRHIHADFTADYYFYKVWKGSKEPTDLKLTATPYAFKFRDVTIEGKKYTINGNIFTDPDGNSYTMENNYFTVGTGENKVNYYLDGNNIITYKTDPDTGDSVKDKSYPIRLDYVQNGNPVKFTVTKEDAEDASETHVQKGIEGGYTTWKISYPAEGYKTKKSMKEWPALPIETTPTAHNVNHVERNYWFVTEEAPGWSLVSYDNSKAEAPGHVDTAKDRKEIYEVEDSVDISAWASASIKDYKNAGDVIKNATDNDHAYMSDFNSADNGNYSWGGKITNVPAVVVNAEKNWEDFSNVGNTRQDVWFHIDAKVTQDSTTTETKDILPPQKLSKDASGNSFTLTWGKKEVYGDSYLSEYKGYEKVKVVASSKDIPNTDTSGNQLYYAQDKNNPHKYLPKLVDGYKEVDGEQVPNYVDDPEGYIYYVNELADINSEAIKIDYYIRETDAQGTALDESDDTKFLTGYKTEIDDKGLTKKDDAQVTVDGVKVDSYTNKIKNTIEVTPPQGTGDETWGPQGEKQTGTPEFTKGTADIDKVQLIDPVTKEPTDAKTVDAFDSKGNKIGSYTLNDNGTVTFTPNEDFVGDPEPAGLTATDKFGKTATAEYQPHVYGVEPLVTKDGQYDSDTGELLRQAVDANKGFKTSSPIKSIKLVDPATGEPTDEKMVKAPEGTYEIDEDGLVTFTPDPSFTGKAVGIKLAATDEAGNEMETTYTPIVVPNKKTATFERVISYKYTDENGNEVDKSYTKTITLEQIGDYDPELDDNPTGYDETTKDAATIDYTGKQWKPASDSDTFEAVKSPVDEGGWVVEKGSEELDGIDGLNPDDPETMKAKGFEQDPNTGVWKKAEEVYYHPEPPKGNTGETWGLPGEKQNSSALDMFSVTTSKTAADGEGNREDNAIIPDSIKLVDPTTGKPTDGAVDAYATVGGKRIKVGTYTYDKGTGQVVFTPDDDFKEGADPEPVELIGTDKNGLTATAKYQPHFAPDTETIKMTRTIDYVYDDGTPVLGSDGKPIVVTQEVTMTRKAIGIDPDTHEPIWGECTPSSGDMSGVKSPTGSSINRDGYVPRIDAVNEVKNLTAEDANKQSKESKYPDITVIYTKPPAAGEKVTYGSKGETQKGTPPFTKGSTDLTDFTLIDPKTGEPTDKITVPGEGSYTCDPKTGEVTFVPEPNFTGKATKVTVRGTDENGYTAEGYYTPNIVDNEQTVEKVQKIEYVYDDGTPVLGEDGKPIVKERKATYKRTGTVDPETGTITWPDWQPAELPKTDSPEVKGYTPDKKSVPASYETPDTWPKDERIVYTKKLPTATWIDPETGQVYKIPTDFIESGVEPPAPKDPTRKGYTFEGWDKEVDEEGNVTYKAKWRPNKYTIKYKANGGTGSMADQKFTGVDDSAKSKDNEFTREGYKFLGFKAMLPDGTYLKDKKGNVLIFKNPDDFIEYLHEQGDGGEITLIAQWEKIEADARPDDTDDDSVANVVKKTVKKAPVAKTGAARTGDEFNLTIWLAVMSISVIGMAAGALLRRKRENL